MYDFTPGAVLLVLASEYYDEADYIRNYDDFINRLQGEAVYYRLKGVDYGKHVFK